MYTASSSTRASLSVSLLSLVLSSCSSNSPPQSPTFTVGGIVTGLSGSGLVLKNNGNDALAIPVNGAFRFSTMLPSGRKYAIEIAADPGEPFQTCTVANGSGTVGGGPVTNIYVSCLTGFAYVPSVPSSEIWAYTISKETGALTPIGGSPFAAGPQSAGIAFAPSNRFAYAPNYIGDSVTVFAVDPTTGVLTAKNDVPAGARPIRIATDPLGRFVYVLNADSQDISAYTIDATTGALSTIPGSPIAGGGSLQDLVVDRAGRFLYVSNFSANSVQAYAIDQVTGTLSVIAGSPYTVELPTRTSVDPAGAFVYVINSAASSISAFAIDSVTGGLTPIAGSPFAAQPGLCAITVDARDHFAFGPNATGQAGNSLSTFTVAASGGLMQIPGPPVPTESDPCSAAVDPTGRFVFTANANSQNVSGYSVDPTTGSLTELPGSPFPAGVLPATIVIR